MKNPFRIIVVTKRVIKYIKPIILKKYYKIYQIFNLYFFIIKYIITTLWIYKFEEIKFLNRLILSWIIKIMRILNAIKKWNNKIIFKID